MANIPFLNIEGRCMLRKTDEPRQFFLFSTDSFIPFQHQSSKAGYSSFVSVRVQKTMF